MAGTNATLALKLADSAPIPAAVATALAGKSATGHTHSRTGGELTGFGTAAGVDVGNGSGQIPVLDATGKFNAARIPTTAITTVTTVGSQAAQTALTDSVGQVAKRSDQGLSYWQFASPASNFANWTTVTDVGVTSVNGLAGVVTLTTTNISEGSNLYHTTARVQTVGDARYSLLSHDHDSRYFTETESDARFAAIVHTHDDRYFTETEADARFAPIVHDHDTQYFTQAVTTTLLSGKANLAAGNSFTGQQIVTVTATGAPISVRVSAGANVGVVFEVKNRLGAIVASIDDTGQISAGLISGIFSGDGSALTNVPAAQITGTVTKAQVADAGTWNVAEIPGGLSTSLMTGLDASLATIATKAPATRAINTTAPLTGGGDLSADRTIAISAATTAAAGSMSAADKTKLDALTEIRSRVSTSPGTTNTTVTAATTGLSFAIGANEVFSFTADLQTQCSSTGGMKFSITGPAGAAVGARCKGTGAAVTAETEQRITALGTLTTAIFNNAAIVGGVRITGTIRNGATPGTVTINFASVTAGQTSTILQDSFLIASKQ